jgi:hypothetical protein
MIARSLPSISRRSRFSLAPRPACAARILVNKSAGSQPVTVFSVAPCESGWNPPSALRTLLHTLLGPSSCAEAATPADAGKKKKHAEAPARSIIISATALCAAQGRQGASHVNGFTIMFLPCRLGAPRGLPSVAKFYEAATYSAPHRCAPWRVYRQFALSLYLSHPRVRAADGMLERYKKMM